MLQHLRRRDDVARVERPELGKAGARPAFDTRLLQSNQWDVAISTRAPEMIICPHCRVLCDDAPQLAGQMVACPHCQGQFEMPGPLAPAPAAPQPLVGHRWVPR